MADNPSAACRICGNPVELATATVCTRCETPFHADCWAYNRGCAVYGCDPARKSEPGKVPGKPGGETASRGRWSFLIAALAVLAASLMRLPAVRGPVTGAPPVAGRLPACQLLVPQSGSMSASEWQGGRIAVITPWVEECPDCMPRMPDLVELSRELARESDLVFCSVAYGGNLRTTPRFVERTGLQGPVLFDAQGCLMSGSGISTLTTLVVDRTGRIRYRGPPDRVAVRQVLEALRAGP